MPNGAAPPGIETGEASSSVRLPPSTAKTLTFACPASTTYRNLPEGSSWASNGRRPGRALHRRAAEEREAAVLGDGVARDGRAAGVDREQVPAVGADRDPARSRLVVGEGRSADRRQGRVLTRRRRRTRYPRERRHGHSRRRAGSSHEDGTRFRTDRSAGPGTGSPQQPSGDRHGRPRSYR